MSKKYNTLVQKALCLVILPMLMCIRVGHAQETITQWSVHELTFTASHSHDWYDFPLRVTFTHLGEEGTPSGTELTLEGYWDGGKTWKVAFAPTRPGLWKWVSLSDDPGLDDHSGSFQVTAPTAGQIHLNPNYRGHLWARPGDRYLTYADSTPFFWLGDTVWNMNSLRSGLEEGSHGRPFYVYLQNRKAKKFTVIQTQFLGLTPLVTNEGGYAFSDYTGDDGSFNNLNPPHFQALDTRVREIWKEGFVLAAHPSWFSQIDISPTGAKRISRYLLARYGAYNLVWSLSGEYQYGYDDEGYRWDTADWNSLGDLVQRHNPYHHPVTVHSSGRKDWESIVDGAGQLSSSGEFHDQEWLDCNWIQTGHQESRLENIPQRVEQDHGETPPKPAIHSEGWYENFDRQENPPTPAQIRWQVWTTFLNGGAGHTYGAVGVWPFYNPDINDDPLLSWNDTTWYEGLELPGSHDLQHVRAFLTSLPWWDLEPHRDWLEVDGKQPAYDYDDGRQDPHLAATPGSDNVVVYIPENNKSRRITVSRLVAGQPYHAYWFDPRNGSRSTTNIDNPITPGSSGEWTVPPRPSPNDEDWVLYLFAVKKTFYMPLIMKQ